MASFMLGISCALSCLGMLYSFSSFFLFSLGNFHGGFWALVAGLLSATDIHLLFLHRRNILASWHTKNTMIDIEMLAVASLLFSLACFAWYVFFFLYRNLPFLPVDKSFQIAAVSAFLSTMCGLGLFLTTRHMARFLEENCADETSSSHHRSMNYYIRIGWR